ncbi:MAG: relaxase/mobilization nuclease domain-containing protein [Anaerococcus vaginalis]|jgi:hypothetical protein|uniref:relaxase/mobilization nuclease domain-containing protein n=1 Tax=Anaerococcus vaginalis TaxID=33037 RepID=UPI002915B00E|nr:relaxase/mobilization nuclease domain-containing protein [Anaerococcus vaginalis]MDU5989422.1 relaxase/mobilization nuclease domain-containing protein [Anaerococcus vaginalis]
MAVIKIQNTRNVVGAIRYLTKEASHDGVHARIGSVLTQNVSFKNADREMMHLLKKFGKTKNVQAYLAIQSFSVEELNPDKQSDLTLATAIGLETARKMWGEDRQIFVVTQADNGIVHNHIVCCSPDIRYGKSLRGKQTNHKYAMEISDQVIEDYGVENLNSQKSEFREKQSMGEIKRREKGLYVWKDDLKNRIRDCMDREDILSTEDFKNVMESDFNVDVRISAKGNLSYRFIDLENKDRKCRASRLGNVYGKDGIEYGITENRIKRNKKSRNKSKRIGSIESVNVRAGKQIDEREFGFVGLDFGSTRDTLEESEKDYKEFGELCENVGRSDGKSSSDKQEHEATSRRDARCDQTNELGDNISKSEYPVGTFRGSESTERRKESEERDRKLREANEARFREVQRQIEQDVAEMYKNNGDDDFEFF